MAEAKFYAYVHRRADSGEIFYVGKGQGQRAASKQYRNSMWRRIVAKHGLLIEIVAYFYEEVHAFDHERALIAEHRQTGVLLANMTDGGEGASGAKRSDETRRRMSAALTGKNTGPRPPETRAKMSASAKGRPMSPEAIAKTAAAHRGMKRSPETLARMSAALKGMPGRPLTQEDKDRLAAAWRGKKHTTEALEKMRAARQKYWADRRAQEAAA
jgi:hypothetical protein